MSNIPQSNVKIPMAYFTELKQIFQKYTWNHKTSQIATAILRKNKVRRIMLPDINPQAIVITTAMYWHKNRHID